MIILPIILVPGLGVSTWLSYLLHMPYKALAISLCIGQIIPAIVGASLVPVLERALGMKRGNMHTKGKNVEYVKSNDNICTNNRILWYS